MERDADERHRRAAGLQHDIRQRGGREFCFASRWRSRSDGAVHRAQHGGFVGQYQPAATAHRKHRWRVERDHERDDYHRREHGHDGHRNHNDHDWRQLHRNVDVNSRDIERFDNGNFDHWHIDHWHIDHRHNYDRRHNYGNDDGRQRVAFDGLYRVCASFDCRADDVWHAHIHEHGIFRPDAYVYFWKWNLP
jgi:hypothetical protein